MKRIIIIGASSGIGRQLAIVYAAAKNIVGVTGRRHNLLVELQAEFPANIIVQSFDNTKDDAELALSQLIDRLGGLDLCIISSGTGYINTSLDWKIEEETIALNVTAWTRIADYIFNYFKKQNSGQLAAITSIASIRGEGRAPAYNASKSYQANYLEGLRKKAFHDKLRITITDIQPGFVKTEMGKSYRRPWEASVAKASKQIFHAIEKKKRKVYITKRWWLVAQMLKILPPWIYYRI